LEGRNVLMKPRRMPSCNWGLVRAPLQALGALVLALSLPSPAPALTITEIHYAPPGGDRSLQFLEVFNEASTSVDLSGWSFIHGITFTFSEGTTLAGRAYLVVAANAEAIRSHYGITNVTGDFIGT